MLYQKNTVGIIKKVAFVVCRSQSAGFGDTNRQATLGSFICPLSGCLRALDCLCEDEGHVVAGTTVEGKSDETVCSI